MTGSAHPAPGERRPFGGSGTVAPDRKGRANGQIAVTQADRPGRPSSSRYFTALFWSFFTHGPSVQPRVTSAEKPALGNSKRFDESGVDESGAAHAKRRDWPKDI